MTPPTTDTAPAVAEFTRTFAAPRALVFEAWSRPELLSRWFGPRDYPVTTCEIDFRPGGTLVVGMTGPDGLEHRTTGRYDEIVASERIVWTIGFEGGLPDQVLTEVTFEDLGRETRVHVRQSFRFLTPETAPFAAGMNEGWRQALENLGSVLTGAAKPGGVVQFRHRLEVVSDTEVRITRDFGAPARLVFDAMTRPDLVARWYGCAFMTFSVNEADVRPGGEFRRVLTLPDGTECAFKGRFVELDPPHRLVFTENFLLGDVWTDDLTYHVTLTERGGTTSLTMQLRYASQAHRDGHLGANMEVGMAESHQRLDQLLATPRTAPAGTICWDELSTTDPAAAQAFYGELLGWDMIPVPICEGESLTLVAVGGRPLGAIRSMRPEAHRAEPRWIPYVATDDVDATAVRARELGATVLAGPYDAGRDGRIALLKDPTGPVLALWNGPGSQLTHGEVGSVCWHDVYPTDGERARAFHHDLLGWEADTFEMEGMEVNTYARAGSEEPQAFSCATGHGYWQPFFSVTDVDALAEKAVALGAKVLVGPMSTPQGGRFVHLLDPQGAPFGLMRSTGA